MIFLFRFVPYKIVSFAWEREYMRYVIHAMYTTVHRISTLTKLESSNRTSMHIQWSAYNVCLN